MDTNKQSDPVNEVGKTQATERPTCPVVSPAGPSETTPPPKSRPSEHGGNQSGAYCNKTRAMQILGVSPATFKKLGLVAAEVVSNPFGYGGKEYLYSRDQIRELASDPEEIKRRLVMYRQQGGQRRNGGPT